MTTPSERYDSMVRTREFLLDLLDCSTTPEVSQIVRNRAYVLLRHFPDKTHLDAIEITIPEVIGRVTT